MAMLAPAEGTVAGLTDVFMGNTEEIHPGQTVTEVMEMGKIAQGSQDGKV